MQNPPHKDQGSEMPNDVSPLPSIETLAKPHPTNSGRGGANFVRLSIDVPPDTRKALKRIALEQDTNVSAVIRGLIGDLI